MLFQNGILLKKLWPILIVSRNLNNYLIAENAEKKNAW